MICRNTVSHIDASIYILCMLDIISHFWTFAISTEILPYIEASTCVCLCWKKIIVLFSIFKMQSCKLRCINLAIVNARSVDSVYY